MGVAFEYETFISHASEDAELATSLCHLLEKKGVRCWIAPRNILPGLDYASEIMKGIELSSAMIVLVSRHSNESVHVPREIEQALKIGRPIFPLLLDGSRLCRQLDYYLSNIQWLHLASADMEDHADAFRRMILEKETKVAQASAPGLLRKLRYGPVRPLARIFFGSLAAMGFASLIAVQAFQFKDQAEQKKLDERYESIGLFSVVSATQNPDSPETWQVDGVVMLAGPEPATSGIKIEIASAAPASEPLHLDLTPQLDPNYVGHMQSVQLVVPKLPKSIIACLTRAHPRLSILYRVEQTYSVVEKVPNAAEFTPTSQPVSHASGHAECGRQEGPDLK